MHNQYLILMVWQINETIYLKNSWNQDENQSVVEVIITFLMYTYQLLLFVQMIFIFACRSERPRSVKMKLDCYFLLVKLTSSVWVYSLFNEFCDLSLETLLAIFSWFYMIEIYFLLQSVWIDLWDIFDKMHCWFIFVSLFSSSLVIWWSIGEAWIQI